MGRLCGATGGMTVSQKVGKDSCAQFGISLTCLCIAFGAPDKYCSNSCCALFSLLSQTRHSCLPSLCTALSMQRHTQYIAITLLLYLNVLIPSYPSNLNQKMILIKMIIQVSVSYSPLNKTSLHTHIHTSNTLIICKTTTKYQYVC